MRTLKKDVRKSLICIFSALFLLSLALFFCMTFLPARAESPFETNYELGETVRIPSRSIDAGGETVQANAVVILPDGSAVSKNSLALEEYGTYTVEYRAMRDGRIYKEVYEFNVDIPFAESISVTDTVEYGAAAGYDDSLFGLNVDLANGSTLTMNTVVNLNELDSGTPLFSFYPLPEEKGNTDAGLLYIRVEDALDPSSYFTIRVRQATVEGQNIVWIMARAYNQTRWAGCEKGNSEDRPLTDGNYGFAGTGSFYGNNVGSPSFKISLYYDNDTATVYSDNNTYGASAGRYVIDFNNPAAFTEGYSGIKSGMARVSVYGGNYRRSSMGFIVTDFAGTDLSSPYVEKDTVAEPVVDFGEYTENSYPQAAVGSPYAIFPAEGMELYTPERVTVNVYTSYYSSSKTNVEITDGTFTPRRAVTHYIEYLVTDGFKKTGVKVVPVEVLSSSTPITVGLDTSPLDFGIGAVLELPVPDIAGGEGVVHYTVSLKDDNSSETVWESSSVSEERFVYRFIRSGSFVLSYVFTDYNGQTAEANIPVTVGQAEKPIISDEPQLSRTYIAGAKYPVPELSAEDFSDGTLKEIGTEVKITVAGEEIIPENGYFTVADGDEITFSFTATDAQGRTETENFTRPIKDVGFGTDLDIAAYFECTGGSAQSTETATVLTAGEDAEFGFIRELMGTSFNAEFNIPGTSAGFGSLTFIFTDVDDPTVSVEISVLNEEGNAMLSVNGGRAVSAGRAFAGALQNYILALSGNTVTLGSVTQIIAQDLSGKEFAGFDGMVYLDMEFGGVTGAASAEIYTLNRHPMVNASSDLGSPQLVINYAYGGNRSINSIMELKAVFAADVADPYVEATVTVRTPDNGYAVSQDGVTLNNAPCGTDYEVLLESYGIYRVSYTMTDSSGNRTPFSYQVECVDEQPPEIKIGADSISVKAGSAAEIPSAEVTDNFTAPEDLDIYILVIAPDGFIYSVKDGSFTPSSAGAYTVRYVALDAGGNMAVADIPLEVK